MLITGLSRFLSRTGVNTQWHKRRCDQRGNNKEGEEYERIKCSPCPRCCKFFPDESLPAHRENHICEVKEMDAPLRERKKMRAITVPEGITITNADGSKTLKPTHLRFEKPDYLIRANCVVSLDFETCAHSCDPIQAGPQTFKIGSSCRAISGCWHAEGCDGFEQVLEREDVIGLRHGLVRAEEHDDVVEIVLLHLLRLAERHYVYQNAFPEFDHSSMTSEEKERHESATVCHACRKPFGDSEAKKRVHDHCHGTGRYRCALHHGCNAQMKQSNQIIVFAHNLARFDGHLIIQAIARLQSHKEYKNYKIAGKNVDAHEVKVLKESNEQYKCITFGPLRFIDSFKFLNSSLAALIDSRLLAGRVKGETLQATFPILSKWHPKAVSSPDKLDLLLQKIPFPYDMMKDATFFAYPTPDVVKEDFDDRLREESISDDEFAKFRFIYRELELGTMGEYHDTYLETDVLALMDIMLGFRDAFWNEFEVDPMHCVSMPSIAFHALMRKLQRADTRVEMLCSCNGGLELLQTLNKNIRGGLCVAFHPYARANNYLCPGYDRRKKMTWIIKMDVTSLYPKAMCSMLPMRDFRKLAFADEAAARAELEKLVKEYRRDSDQNGSMFTVDLKIPEDKHDFFDLAPAMKSEVPDEWLSEQQVARRKFYGASCCEKLIHYLGEHVQVTHHIAYLQMLCKLGVEVTKVYHDKCWGFH